jgi:hypothetical protein
MPFLLRFYGATAAAGAFFGSVIWAFGAPRSREQLAVTAVTICLSVGGLFFGSVYTQALTATGAKRWAGGLVLGLLVLLPVMFLLIMPRGGPIALATITLLLLVFAHEPKGDGSG